jgi:hypothetical protein
LAASAFELAVAKRVVEAKSGGAAGASSGVPEAADLVRRLLPPGPGPGADVVEDLERRVAELLRERLPVWMAQQIV